MNFFGKKKEVAAPATTAPSNSKGGQADSTQTIVNFRETLKTLDKREDHIQKKADAMIVEAKKKLAGKDKKGALFAMKRKKMYEAEVEKINGLKMSIESQMMTLESNIHSMEMFKVMKAGKAAMAKVRANVEVDNVDEMMDEIREEMETANEISDAISRPIDDAIYDEDELLNELNELEETELENMLLTQPEVKETEYSLPSAPKGAMLPTAPSGKVVAEEEDEDAAALRELEASMMM